MNSSRAKKSTRPSYPLVGCWKGDEWGSDVEYIVTRVKGSYAVRAIDANDGEEAHVFEVKWDDHTLSFSAQWESTGRFTRCRMRYESPDRVHLTYTYTAQELWRRGTPNKAPEPTAGSASGEGTR